MSVGVCWGTWQLLLCVGECKDYLHSVGITNIWPLPRAAQTHTVITNVLCAV